ncbi:unnamed protein product [Ectocarpus sp. 12 AP-2014]
MSPRCYCCSCCYRCYCLMLLLAAASIACVPHAYDVAYLSCTASKNTPPTFLLYIHFRPNSGTAVGRQCPRVFLPSRSKQFLTSSFRQGDEKKRGHRPANPKQRTTTTNPEKRCNSELARFRDTQLSAKRENQLDLPPLQNSLMLP